MESRDRVQLPEAGEETNVVAAADLRRRCRLSPCARVYDTGVDRKSVKSQLLPEEDTHQTDRAGEKEKNFRCFFYNNLQIHILKN